MNDNDCVDFLQWALPKLNMRWKGFRKVRKRVCRRVQKRMDELGIGDIQGYKNYLDGNEKEWDFLDTCCRISISRFYRDRGLYDTISNKLVPIISDKASENSWDKIKVWSVGCASGEEPYTVKIIWEDALQENKVNQGIEITATDINRVVLDRASDGEYSRSSFWELPEKFFKKYFYEEEELYRIKEGLKEGINFLEQDVRKEAPRGKFHVILCRNLVFTYFDKRLQMEILAELKKHLVKGGFLIIGCHEELPDRDFDLKKVEASKMIYCKVT